MRIHLQICILLTLLFSHPFLAAAYNREDFAQPTLEWIVADASRIVRAKVIAAPLRSVAPGNTLFECYNGFLSENFDSSFVHRTRIRTFDTARPDIRWNLVYLHITETLKGAPETNITFCAEDSSNLARLNDWDDSADYLLLINDQKKYIEVLDLRDPEPSKIIDMRRKVISRSDDLLAAIRTAAGFPAARHACLGFPDVPMFFDETNREALNLIVPIDSRLETLGRALVRSPDIGFQFTGIAALAFFPTPDNIALIRPFLQNPMNMPTRWTRASPWTAQLFPLRSAAALALHQMGAPAPDYLVLGPPRRYYQCPWPLAIPLLLILPIAVWLLLGCLRLARPRLPRAGILALTAFVISCAFYAHSFYRAHDFAFTCANTFFDFTLHKGILRVEALRNFHHACPPSYICLELTPPDNLWHEFQDPPYIAYGTGGADHFDRLADGPLVATGLFDDGAPYHYRYFQIPKWPLPTLTAIVLLSILPFRRLLRQRHRRKNNLCLACGYDLRASPTRCPECGTPREVRPSA